MMDVVLYGAVIGIGLYVMYDFFRIRKWLFDD